MVVSKYVHNPIGKIETKLWSMRGMAIIVAKNKRWANNNITTK